MVQIMVQGNKKNDIDEALVKFRAPAKLKRSLQTLADERNIALSALLRLISSEYVRRNQST